MTVAIVVQRRFMELGRVRLGEKGPSGEPRKLEAFRFTSASRRLLEHVAEQYGGTVTEWDGAPNPGYYQVNTEATSIDIILPPTFSEHDGTPTTSYSQWYELWSAGGCQRRCDGLTESLTGGPCLCDPDDRTCKIVTRVSFIIPSLPGLGVWRLDSGGWNAAVELPGTLELLASAASEQRFIPAVLSLQNRVSKKDGQTRRYVVPVIELPDVTIGQLVDGTAPTLALNSPAATPQGRPELPSAPAPPADNGFDHDTPGFGEPPALPLPGDTGDTPREQRLATKPMKDKLDVLVGRLRGAGHITTIQLWHSQGYDPGPDDLEEDGALHWRTLRERLNRAQAHDLIDRLEALEQKLAGGYDFEGRAAEARAVREAQDA